MTQLICTFLISPAVSKCQRGSTAMRLGRRPGGNRAGGRPAGRQPTPSTLADNSLKALPTTLRPLLDNNPSLLAAAIREQSASLSAALGSWSSIGRYGRAVLVGAGHAGVWPLRPARHGVGLVGLSCIESVMFPGVLPASCRQGLQLFGKGASPSGPVWRASATSAGHRSSLREMDGRASLEPTAGALRRY
jgi:hypothetical protein